ncbi:L,D-transpeptidase [Phenylobacterium sp. LjRoot225]|uniref:L,D-transpeptidase n=1 Tax=Phenylobacterium sp. LjRoot225 TaxID=3342285 RepID=UPI003ECC35DA
MRQRVRTAVTGLATCLAVLSAGLIPTTAAATENQADLRPDRASKDARQVADWVIVTGDNKGLPFVIVDKLKAEVFVFYRDGRLRGAAPVLLGLARGDNTVPGIGERKLSSIRPEERTTPAGRFVSALGVGLGKKDLVWIDYGAAISLHRVVTSNPRERRLQRLATASPLDNRISYGCINVPASFYDAVIRPSFTGTNGIVYVLPEVRSIHDVFLAHAEEPAP